MDYSEVSPEEAARLVREEGYKYVDVRRVDEYELGHAAGAFNVPWILAGQTPTNPQFLTVMEAAFGKQQALVIGCQTGRRSHAASEFLRAHGFTRVADQRSGFAGRRDEFGQITEPGWERTGLTVETTGQPGRSYGELLEGRPHSR
jgi:rhodanese-related sulfurtransferase